jgi:hypothetical protein
MDDQSTQSTGQTSAVATDDSTAGDDALNKGIIIIEGKEILIDPDIKTKYAELLELIKNTGSMSFDEKEYWVQLLPIMNNAQIKNLQGILGREKKKLAEIDAKYSKKMEDISQKYINRWDSEKNKLDKAQLHSKESAEEAAEAAQEEDLLSALE